MDTTVVFQKTDRAIHRTIASTTILLDLHEGTYYTLNEVGGLVFNRCDGKHTVDEIIHEICSRYEVEPDHAVLDVEVLCGDLRNQKFIREVPTVHAG